MKPSVETSEAASVQQPNPGTPSSAEVPPVPAEESSVPRFSSNVTGNNDAEEQENGANPNDPDEVVSGAIPAGNKDNGDRGSDGKPVEQDHHHTGETSAREEKHEEERKRSEVNDDVEKKAEGGEEKKEGSPAGAGADAPATEATKKDDVEVKESKPDDEKNENEEPDAKKEEDPEPPMRQVEEDEDYDDE